MNTVRLARHAMACRWELVLQGDDPVRLRAAGEEALTEVQRLEAQLSFYRPTSEISRINAQADTTPVRVEPRLFQLLQKAKKVHQQTGGAFDLTIGPLMHCWGFVNDMGRRPSQEAVARVMERTGMQYVVLDEQANTIQFERPGMQLDLGAIGKGYAVDEAVWLLREAGIEHAFLHSGTSTIYALGAPIDADAWTVAIPQPGREVDPGADDVLTTVALNDEALSVSAVWGKAFEADGKLFGHVLDPRKGRPVEGAALSAIVGPSATEADALSTALLVLGKEGYDLMQQWERLRALVVLSDGSIHDKDMLSRPSA